jgi:hypothetical protein
LELVEFAPEHQVGLLQNLLGVGGVVQQPQDVQEDAPLAPGQQSGESFDLWALVMFWEIAHSPFPPLRQIRDTRSPARHETVLPPI